MVTLNGLKQTLMVTRAYHIVCLIRLSKKRKALKFSNGSTYNVTWEQFWILRDNYDIVKKFSVLQVGDDSFKLKFCGLEVNTSSKDLREFNRIARGVLELKEKYVIQQLDSNLFKIKSDNFEITGFLHMLFSFWEHEKGAYGFDFNNKIILDIGGFQGESAVFFHKMGAKKIIIYEPLASLHEFIQKNILLNKVCAEIHSEGIGRRLSCHI